MARITKSLKNRVEMLESIVGSREEKFDGERNRRIAHYLRSIPGFIEFSLGDLMILYGEEFDGDAEDRKSVRTQWDVYYAEAARAVDSGEFVPKGG